MAKRLKWGTIEYLNTLIDEYFEDKNIIPNIAGLCLKLQIGKDCWQYYLNERWRTHRKSEEEIEEMNSKENDDDRAGNAAYEELMEIDGKPLLLSEFSQEDRRENDALKAQVSASVKRAALKLDDFVTNSMFNAKNPAGAIFYAKAALGYRETTPENDQPKLAPGAINIIIMPPPEKPQQIIETTTYSVLPEK